MSAFNSGEKLCGPGPEGNGCLCPTCANFRKKYEEVPKGCAPHACIDCWPDRTEPDDEEGFGPTRECKVFQPAEVGGLRYSREEYENCDFYGNNDDEISTYKCRLGKCRKPHICANCGKEIKKGEYALRESGFSDSGPVSCYTCVPCLDAWIAETNGEGVGE